MLRVRSPASVLYDLIYDLSGANISIGNEKVLALVFELVPIVGLVLVLVLAELLGFKNFSSASRGLERLETSTSRA